MTKKYSNPKNDISKVALFLAEELEGIEAYKGLREETPDADLTKIVDGILVDEKRHANSLLQWINSAASAVLK